MCCYRFEYKLNHWLKWFALQENKQKQKRQLFNLHSAEHNVSHLGGKWESGPAYYFSKLIAVCHFGRIIILMYELQNNDNNNNKMLFYHTRVDEYSMR